jgi:hypothetical protein
MRNDRALYDWLRRFPQCCAAVTQRTLSNFGSYFVFRNLLYSRLGLVRFLCIAGYCFASSLWFSAFVSIELHTLCDATRSKSPNFRPRDPLVVHYWVYFLLITWEIHWYERSRMIWNGTTLRQPIWITVVNCLSREKRTWEKERKKMDLWINDFKKSH